MALRSDGTGSYYVAVSNGGGTTISSNAILKVLVLQRFSAATILNNHTIIFLSGDSDGGLLTLHQAESSHGRVCLEAYRGMG